MKRTIALSLVLATGLGPGVPTEAAAPPPQQASMADWVLPGSTTTLPAPLSEALGGLHAQAIAAHIALLASPGLEGRGLGTRGLDAAAEYVAATLSLAGVPPLDPAGKGLVSAPYFHPVPLREISHPSGQVIIDTRRGEGTNTQTFLSGVDCLFPELPPEAFTAPVVFAGYGIREASPARDDYRDLDVKDKVVALIGGLPPGAAWQTPALRERYGSASARQRYAAKLELAASLGVRAILAIEGEDLAGILASGSQAPAPVFFVPADAAPAALPPVVRVSLRVGEAILGQAGPAGAGPQGAAPGARPAVRATIRVLGDQRLVVSRNVIGIIRGADPRLRDEAVVIGTHMDHLGTVGSAVYPGADDNASGVSALLEIARAFAASPHRPRRTLVFAFWTGEEEGKLGSGYYVRHPLWPLDRTAVYLNLDMIGHPWTPAEIRQLAADTRLGQGADLLRGMDPADFIELGVAEWAPDLGPFLLQAARGTALALHLDRTDGRNGGSDYRDFARHGLPWVRFFGNYFEGYHEPRDTAETLDAGQVLKVARLAFASAWLLAER